MKKIYLIWMTCCLGIALAACYEDKGNYTYQEIGGVEVTFEQDTFSIVRGDTLRIQPKLTFTDGYSEEDFSYEWEAIVGDFVPGETTRRFLLGQEKDLKCVLTLRDRSVPYRLYFYVTEKENGVRHFFEVRVEVSTAVSKGWMVLCDVDGKTRLDMISMNLKDTLVIPDILTKINAGVPELRGPLSIGYVRDGVPYRYSLNTRSGSWLLNTATLEAVNNINWLFFTSVPSDFYVHTIFYASPNEWALGGNGNFYYKSRTDAGAGFGDAVNRFASRPDSLIPVSNFVAYATYGGDFMERRKKRLLYDNQSRKFIVHKNTSDLYCSEVKHERTHTLFQYSNIGKDLVSILNTTFVVPGKGSYGASYAIFRDEARTWLYVFEASATFKQLYVQELPEQANRSEWYTVNNKTGYLYYSDGECIYGWNPLTGKSLEELNFTKDDGEEITFLRFSGNLLVVGSWVPFAGHYSGKLTFYTTDALTGELTLSGKPYRGIGKVVDIYKK